MNDAAKDNYYLYNSKELNVDHGLNWSDYGARWYDGCVGRWGSLDPLAEKYSEWSSYSYVKNNPIRLIDPDGKASADAMGDPITDIKQTLSNTAASVQRKVSAAIDYTRNELAPAVGNAAGVVAEYSDYVQYAALATTAVTSGSSAPATVPIAATAEGVGKVALGFQAMADYIQNGNFNKTGSEVIIKAIAGVAAAKASKSISAMIGVNEGTKAATDAVAQTMLNTSEKITNKVISNIKADTKLSNSTHVSQSVATYKFTVTDNNKRN